jgi:predicted ATPase
VAASVGGIQVVYLHWPDLQNQPLMKDDFAQFFREARAGFILIDRVPFFAEIAAEQINLTFLGHLSRFVNFVDAVHDCRLPLLVRGTQAEVLDTQTVGQTLRAALYAYDARTKYQHGQAAWVEWSRCLSRLRSREAINAQVLAD